MLHKTEQHISTRKKNKTISIQTCLKLKIRKDPETFSLIRLLTERVNSEILRAKKFLMNDNYLIIQAKNRKNE